MRNGKFITMFGAIACTCLTTSVIADDPYTNAGQSDAVVLENNDHDGPGVSACDSFVFDAGQLQNYTRGWNVGSYGPDDPRYEVYQRWRPQTDLTVCGVDVIGFYVQGPDTLRFGIFPDNSGCADFSNPMTMSEPGNLGPHWDEHTSFDFDPVCLEAGTTYWIGTDTGENNDHRSALNYGSYLKGDLTYQVISDECPGELRVDPLALRVRGVFGCDHCFTMNVSPLNAGQTGFWTISGAGASASGVVVWGFSPGETPVNEVNGFCATFGIDGVSPRRIVGFWNADANGDALLERGIPAGTTGLEVHTQAAQQGTCPEDCDSNVDSQVIG